MAEALDPTGTPVRVGNVTLVTPGLVGQAESHLPATPGMRAAESATPAFDAALAAEGLRAQETIELTGTQEVSIAGAVTRSTAYQEPAIEVTVPDPGPGWGQVLIASDETGVLTWNIAQPRVQAPTMRGSATRTYVVRRHVPLRPADPLGPTRGLMGALATKVLKVVAFKLIDVVAGQVGDYFAGRWEAKRRPYGVRSFTPSNYSSPDVLPLDGDGWSRLSEGPALLLIHGTFSRTNTAFGGLAEGVVEEFAHRYDGRVFGFDHFTLSEDPLQNVEWLVGQIPDAATLELDVISHSRGGLVARVLAEKQSEIRLGSRRVTIGKAAFVGVPNAGTVLADSDHLGDLVDSYTNLLNFFPDTGIVDVIQTVIAVVKQIAVGAMKGLDGLQAMAPGGPFLAALNEAAISHPGYYALASNFEPTDPGLKAWVADRLMDPVFSRAANDLVVPAAGVFSANGSSLFPIARPIELQGTEGVPHTRYFSSQVAQSSIETWLGLR